MWIAVLGLGSDRADLYVAETDVEKTVYSFSMLVEACGKADRIGEVPAPELSRKSCTSVSTQKVLQVGLAYIERKHVFLIRLDVHGR